MTKKSIKYERGNGLGEERLINQPRRFSSVVAHIHGFQTQGRFLDDFCNKSIFLQKTLLKFIDTKLYAYKVKEN
jgi:hypothetical protein